MILQMIVMFFLVKLVVDFLNRFRIEENLKEKEMLDAKEIGKTQI